jgi:osomolarity two-component system response regulator SKN7
MGGDLNDTVYPVGHIPPNSIDPMYQQQIPYPVPQNPGLEPTDPRRAFTTRKKSATLDPGWTRTPNILLVEDDPTCRRIGGKFLLSFKCAIDSAFDGLEAVNKLNHGAKYDLVLMDIIMPNLDGVSATHLIRGFDSTPIIAMTSNIRSDDISMYFSHGMNDVLPKPFTKEGLLTMLEKHLGHLKVPKQSAPLPRAINASSTAASHSDGQSPGKSPTDRWGQSPRNSGPQDVSPSSATVTDEYMSSTRGPQYAVENPIHRGTGTAFSSPTSVGTPGQRGHRRVASDMEDSHIENEAKRQRLYMHQTAPSIPGMHMPSVPPG